MVLTTRPGAWTHQIDIMRGDAHKDRRSGQEGRDLVGQLLPLSYPDDVDAFIGRWFADDEGQARVLIDQIADRPDLQDLVTVPLTLTLLCIMGGNEPLPRFRRELFARAVNRLLTGSWRHAPPGPADRDVLLGQLRAWAWEAATDHPVSGVGTWADEIATAPLPLDERHRLRRLDQPALDALDHVATPTRVANVDTGTTPRRFIHRSVQEHLVAEHLADPHRFPLSEVTEILLPHLWFDTDWEYAAPAAVAGRPDRDALLRALILRAARAERIPSDISIIDGTYEFRAFLARLATQSDDTDWSEEMARIIGDARVALARDLRLTPVVASAHWAESNERARAALMTTLRERGKELRGASIHQWGHALVRLGGSPDERASARAALLQLVATRTEGHLEMGSQVAGDLLDELVRLGPTRAEEMQARQILGGLRERLHTETEI
jgi:hypothetical protein